MVELPRLRLPLPERTGSDRDELLSPHGFVDRAYSVFLQPCVALLRTYSLRLRDFSVRPSPLGSCFGPEAVPHSRAVLLRGVNEGTSPRAHSRPSLPLPLPLLLLLLLPLPTTCPAWYVTARKMPRWRSGGSRADGGARPARVPSELKRPLSPHEIPDHLRLATVWLRHNPYPLATPKQGACQSQRARPRFTALGTTSHRGNELARPHG